jgi:hypothetical protein
MKWHPLSGSDWRRAIGVGIAVSVLTVAFMAATMKAAISPLPKPLGLAFAETLLRRPLPLPVGLLFHTAWVTAFAVAYVGFFRDELTFARALGLAIGLWILVLIVFFPIVGWGFFGLAISPKLIVGSAVPHLLFAVLLWGFCRWAFKETQPAAGRQPIERMS